MEKYSIREVVEQAIQTEKLGYALYLAMANRIDFGSSLSALAINLSASSMEYGDGNPSLRLSKIFLLFACKAITGASLSRHFRIVIIGLDLMPEFDFD